MSRPPRVTERLARYLEARRLEGEERVRRTSYVFEDREELLRQRADRLTDWHRELWRRGAGERVAAIVLAPVYALGMLALGAGIGLSRVLARAGGGLALVLVLLLLAVPIAAVALGVGALTGDDRPRRELRSGQVCSSSYVGVCIPPDLGDYDCAGGIGEGPFVERGNFRVRGPDVFNLDGDGDGKGCENTP